MDADEVKLKAAFAAFFHASEESDKHRRGFDAALKIYPREADRGKCLQIAWEWPDDPSVIIEIQRLDKEKPVADGIPSKETVIKEMWKLVENERTSAKDRATTARLVAEMLNYIPKGTGDEESRVMPREPVYKIVQK